MVAQAESCLNNFPALTNRCSPHSRLNEATREELRGLDGARSVVLSVFSRTRVLCMC